MDSIYTSGDHLKGGGLLGGVYTLQETGLTGPISIYKRVPKVIYHRCSVTRLINVHSCNVITYCQIGLLPNLCTVSPGHPHDWTPQRLLCNLPGSIP